MKRSAGILLPIFSLPSKYGIGTVGKEAYKFVDFLKKAKQSYWQILPIGPTAYGDSPYSPYSVFAGNPYFIDLDMLKDDGLLTSTDLNKLKRNTPRISYSWLYKTRYEVLYKAYKNGYRKYKASYDRFCNNNKKWLNDYALYMSLRKYFGDICWNKWPDKSIQKREKKAINKYTKLLDDEIKFHKFTQYLFFKQFNKLRSYMKKKNVKLIGDIPIYVSLDSSDVWTNPKCFKLTSKFVPKVISGCPPDSTSKVGQVWGNPIYDYSYLKKNNYKWWLDRIKGASKIYDVIRIDHFRGFESYWEIPYGRRSATSGKWVKGPGMDLLGKIKTKYKNVEFIAEDLGIITEELQKLVEDFGYPGMKVIQYGFGTRGRDLYTPYSCSKNTVCYTGTHDNNTVMGFYKTANKKYVNKCIKYFNIKSNFNDSFIRGGLETSSILFMAQLQDYLGLDNRARINVPATSSGNWTWRTKNGSYNDKLAKKIRELTILYGRAKKSRSR